MLYGEGVFLFEKQCRILLIKIAKIKFEKWKFKGLGATCASMTILLRGPTAIVTASKFHFLKGSKHI